MSKHTPELLEAMIELTEICEEIAACSNDIEAGQISVYSTDFQSRTERARAAITKSLGTPATNPEAASAFDEMMGYAAFPSIKGEQK